MLSLDWLLLVPFVASVGFALDMLLSKYVLSKEHVDYKLFPTLYFIMVFFFSFIFLPKFTADLPA